MERIELIEFSVDKYNTRIITDKTIEAVSNTEEIIDINLSDCICTEDDGVFWVHLDRENWDTVRFKNYSDLMLIRYSLKFKELKLRMMHYHSKIKSNIVDIMNNLGNITFRDCLMDDTARLNDAEAMIARDIKFVLMIWAQYTTYTRGIFGELPDSIVNKIISNNKIQDTRYYDCIYTDRLLDITYLYSSGLEFTGEPVSSRKYIWNDDNNDLYRYSLNDFLKQCDQWEIDKAEIQELRGRDKREI